MIARFVSALLVALLLSAACGGGGSPSTPAPPPTPTPTPAPAPAPAPALNPCSAVGLEADEFTIPARSTKRATPDQTGRWRVLDAIWGHRTRGANARGIPANGAVAEDAGDIVVVRDQRDLILPPNAFDLRSTGLRFTRNAAGGYDIARIDAALRGPAGDPLSLEDDDSNGIALPFVFTFYGQAFDGLFVNSDGNVTFGEGDDASTARTVARLLTGPPRIAPFLADLDPSTGGRVFVRSDANGFVATWCGVRGFDSPQVTTFQMALLPDSSIEMKFGDTITLDTAIVGVSPGHTGTFAPQDLSAAARFDGGAAATGERFGREELDTVAVAQTFYRNHLDVYDQLIIWTDVRLLRDAFAQELTVSNAIRGLGLDEFNVAPEFGSPGRLQSIVVMDDLAKYPDDPAQRFLGENTTLSLLGQESGHRWLAFLRFRDHSGTTSDALLGRDDAHWSFFFDSDASFMEGNDIEALGGGQFRTAAAVQRFSLLDQYAMGLVGPEAVPPFFYVEAPLNVQPPGAQPGSAPQVGVTFAGTRRDVLIDDVVAVMGPRQPASADAPKVHRQAFLFVVGQGRIASAAQMGKLDRFRRDWESAWTRATDGRGRLETRLRPPT